MGDMVTRSRPDNAITPQLLLEAYASGLFPMAEGQDSPELSWIDPDERGIIPLDSFHIPRRLTRKIRRDLFEVRTNSAFARVIRACAAPSPGRPTTWINKEIVDLYTDLHVMDFAHTVECWQANQLVGGLYGISIGGAFFGESMFSLETDASKVALVHLVARLKYGGFRLLDTQFITRHLLRFGAIQVTREDYRRRLTDALTIEGNFMAMPDHLSGSTILQSITHIS